MEVFLFMEIKIFMEFIQELVLILLTSTVLGQIFVRFDMPAVIGELLAGVLLGTAVLNWVRPSNLISVFSQIGVILLMTLAGMESDINLLKKCFKVSFCVASVGVILPIILMGIASYLYGVKPLEAILIGIIFSATSVSISAIVLEEKHQLHSIAGTTILGAAVVDDILSVIVLGLFTTLSQGTGNKQSTNNIMVNTIIQLLFFSLLYLLYKFVPYLKVLFLRIKNNQIVNIIYLLLIFTVSWIAEAVGLSAIIGAYFCGLAIRQLENYKKVYKAISNIGYEMFIPIFFVNIGLMLTFKNFYKELVFILIMIILAIASKFWAGKYTSRILGLSKSSSDIVGAGIISRGEVALIVAQMGCNSRLLSENIYSSLIIVIVVTTILSPIILNYFIKKANSDVD